MQISAMQLTNNKDKNSHSLLVDWCPYLVPFSRYGEILVANHKFFLPHMYLASTLEVTHIRFYQNLWYKKS